MKVDLDDTINSLVENLLAVPTSEYYLHIEFDVRIYNDDFDKQDDFHTYRFLFWRASNYTGVFFSEVKKMKVDYRCTSYHDSCWRSDGVQRVIFNLNRELGLYKKKDDRFRVSIKKVRIVKVGDMKESFDKWIKEHHDG